MECPHCREYDIPCENTNCDCEEKVDAALLALKEIAGLPSHRNPGCCTNKPKAIAREALKRFERWY